MAKDFTEMFSPEQIEQMHQEAEAFNQRCEHNSKVLQEYAALENPRGATLGVEDGKLCISPRYVDAETGMPFVEEECEDDFTDEKKPTKEKVRKNNTFASCNIQGFGDKKGEFMYFPAFLYQYKEMEKRKMVNGKWVVLPDKVIKDVYQKLRIELEQYIVEHMLEMQKRKNASIKDLEEWLCNPYLFGVDDYGAKIHHILHGYPILSLHHGWTNHKITKEQLCQEFEKYFGIPHFSDFRLRNKELDTLKEIRISSEAKQRIKEYEAYEKEQERLKQEKERLNQEEDWGSSTMKWL